MLHSRARPSVGENTGLRVEMLTHLFQLISTEEMDERIIFAQIEANVTSPAHWLVSPQHRDASRNGPFNWRSPVKPRSGKG